MRTVSQKQIRMPRLGEPTLSNEPVQVLIVGSFDAEAPAANVIDGFIVYHEAAVRVFQRGMGRQDRVVRLHDGRRYLGSRINAELQLALLPVINRKALHQQSAEA